MATTTTDIAKATIEGLAAIGKAKTRAEESELTDRVALEVLKVLGKQELTSRTNHQDYEHDEELGIVPSHVAAKRRNPGMYHLIHKAGAADTDERVRQMQDWNDVCYIASKAMGVDVRHLKTYREGVEDMTELGKAMNAATATEGGNFVPTDLSAQVVDLMESTLKVATLFQSIDMPTNPFQIPQKTGRSTTYLVNESTVDNPNLFRASTPTIGQLTLTAIKFANRVNLSDELTEDGIIAMLPFIREDIATSQARAVEEALISGDTTATHQDSDVTGVDDTRKSITGIRKLVNADAKYDVDEDGAGTLDIEDFRNVRKLMQVNSTGAALYGEDPASLTWLTSVHLSLKIMNSLKDYITTLDKIGDKATILRGQIASLDGIPLLTSEFVRTNLNASGVYDGSVTTKSQVIVIHRDAGIIGRRRQLKIEQDRVIGADQTILVSTQRFDFQPRFPTTENTLALMNDITA